MKIDKAEFVRRLRKLEGEEVTADQIAQLAQAMALMAKATGGGDGGESAPEPEEPAAMSAADPAVLSADAPPAAPVAAAAEPEAAPAPEGEAASLLEQVMQATGMDLAALVEALKGLAGGQMPAAPAPLSAGKDGDAVILASTKKALSAVTKERDEALQALSAYREREADDAVAVLVDSGRLLDNGRAVARELYLSNRPAFDQFAAALPEIVPVGQHASATPPPTEETPAIDESDPEVASLRRTLSNTRLAAHPEKIDAAIVKMLRDRKATNARV